ncbi:MAG: FadR family transcriptional regulator [Selenomonadaceae bacterium]|nr:FadR family transcriptional regulator [Selenomonadaceae bacterium]
MEREHIKVIGNVGLTQQIIDRIKKGILTKELVPGDQLPTNEELAKILGVQTKNVKEAIMYLTAMGVLEIHHTQGTFVSRGFSHALMEPIIYGIILCKSDSLEELKEMHKFTVLAVLNLAVKKALKKEIDQMSAHLKTLKKELEKKNNLDNIVAADDNFYLTAINASHNLLLVNIVKTARTYTAESRRAAFKRMLSRKVDIDKITQNHAALLKVFKNKELKDLTEIVMNDPLYN